MLNSRKLALAAALVASAIIPVPASAEVECKPSPMAALGQTPDIAIAAWRNQATNMFGAEWANLDLAQGKASLETVLGVTTIHSFAAHPCRDTMVTPAIEQQPVVAPGP